MSAMTRTPRDSLLLRTSVAFSVVLAMHVAIFQVMTGPSGASPTEPAPPAMQAMLFEEQRISPEAIPEPRLSNIQMGLLDIAFPEVLDIDPSAAPSKVERPVDLSSAKPVAEPVKHVSLANAGDVNEQTLPHFDQALRPLPADVIASQGSVGPVGSQLTLNVWVEPSGRVSRVYVVRSSGALWVDRATTQYARTWTLRPGTTKGIAQGMWAEFTLLVGSDLCCTTVELTQ